jgi:hypothetical protein
VQGNAESAEDGAADDEGIMDELFGTFGEKLNPYIDSYNREV